MSVTGKGPLHFSFDATHDHNWSFCYFLLYTVDDPVLYEAITTLWLLPHSGLLIIYSF